MSKIQEEILICSNKEAYYHYFVLEKFECGIELKGTEVKALREGKANLKDSFAMVANEEVILNNMYIGHYLFGNRYNHEPLRNRKLLLHKSEIIRLIGKTKEKGLSLIPIKLYFNKKGYVKIEIALCKGKKLFDKRESLKRREAEREIGRAFKEQRHQ
ncbi:SsrA-binding protein SmpB [Candidatus Poribacteria bacterium]|nr:SsrA-binding protein SmpB [Candidatus Poribacteria bacterium]